MQTGLTYRRASRWLLAVTAAVLIAVRIGSRGAVPHGHYPNSMSGMFEGKRQRSKPRFTITDIGRPGHDSTATAINNNGQVTGELEMPGRGDVYIWQDGKISDLGRLPAKKESMPRAINAAGDIVGSASSGFNADTSPPSAFLFRNGVLTGLFPDGRDSEASAINDSGQVVGQWREGAKPHHAFVFQHGTMTEIGSLNGGDTIACDINKVGQVVGASATSRQSSNAYLWDAGKIRDLGTLGGIGSKANGINDRGQVVGTSRTTEGFEHAFLWTDGKMKDLGSPGAGLCEAKKINNNGVIVGFWWPDATGYQGSRALVGLEGKMYDLNDLIPAKSGWVLEYAISLNDKGEIVGNGKHNGVDRGFLLTPVSLDGSKRGGKPGGAK